MPVEALVCIDRLLCKLGTDFLLHFGSVIVKKFCLLYDFDAEIYFVLHVIVFYIVLLVYFWLLLLYLNLNNMYQILINFYLTYFGSCLNLTTTIIL